MVVVVEEVVSKCAGEQPAAPGEGGGAGGGGHRGQDRGRQAQVGTASVANKETSKTKQRTNKLSCWPAIPG